MYSNENIIWIKNVKRNKGEGWAYDEVICGSNFLLNWPTKKHGSASTPNVGDIIVLFQKPNQINGKKNYHVHITHLVSPVSTIIYPDGESPDHMWCREVKLIAKANPISAIPNPGYYNFFKPNRGLTNPMINLTNNIGLSEFETQEDIWQLFSRFFCQHLVEEIFNPKKPIAIFGELEGDKVVREHIKQELRRRNSRIVQQAKSNALLANNGRLKCESCDFDFVTAYGALGSEFIECHHKIHISSGERLTNPGDLALVCSNCHRMLHRKLENDSYHTIETLKEIINSLKENE